MQAAPEEKPTVICDANGALDPQLRDMLKSAVESIGYNFIEGEIEACSICGYYECVCMLRTMHSPGCPYRKAMESSVSIECEHGFDICPQCDVCDCKE
jgi:hypothetical protein